MRDKCMCAVPWLTKLANAVIQGKLDSSRVALAREAVDNFERLGPTYIKLGQILSIRCVQAVAGGQRRQRRC